MITSFLEVCALCGFVFGVACKLPPSLTILMLNGCFCFPIGFYIIYDSYYTIRTRKYSKVPNREDELSTNDNLSDTYDSYGTIRKYSKVPNEEDKSLTNDNSSDTKDEPIWLFYLLKVFEGLGCIMQFGVPIVISILLSMENFYSPSGKAKHYITATYILIPVSLYIISIVWSGWLQYCITIPAMIPASSNRTARYKTGKYIDMYLRT